MFLYVQVSRPVGVSMLTRSFYHIFHVFLFSRNVDLTCYFKPHSSICPTSWYSIRILFWVRSIKDLGQVFKMTVSRRVKFLRWNKLQCLALKDSEFKSPSFLLFSPILSDRRQGSFAISQLITGRSTYKRAFHWRQLCVCVCVCVCVVCKRQKAK